MNWILGSGCVVLFVMMNVALSQRDEARRASLPVLELENKSITLICIPANEVTGND